jgi:chromosome partitioning protein
MAKIIAMAQHKGGVGKTTSTANIGAGLALKGIKTLVIDLDPQANLTTIMGGPQDYASNIYNVLSGKAQPEALEISEDLYLLPSTLDLSGAEMELAGVPGREFILKEKIAALKDNFEVVLIDCPPSLGLLTVNALVASSDILLPLQAQFLAMHGLGKLTEVINLIKGRGLNPELELSGVFVTMFDSRRTLDNDVAEVIKKDFREKVFETKVRNTVALSEAGFGGISIFEYDPKSNASKDYAELTDEIIKNVIKG